MNRFFIVLLGFAFTTLPLLAETNSVILGTTNAIAKKGTNAPPVQPDPNDPVEKEYKKILDDDDAAQAEVDKWIRDNEKFAGQGAGVPPAELKRRIEERFRPVQLAYAKFVKQHPDHARARLAYGSFLGDMEDEEGAEEQFEKAVQLDPTNPAPYNNLANIYTHHGPIKKAFEYYAKAIELNASEPVYYHNFGTAVFLFRKDAREYYNIDEQQVFNKALELYSHALKLDPDNFPLASDVAQTYYGIKPMRIDDALRAWTNTLAIAHDEIEREGVYIHFARLNLIGKRFDLAWASVNRVTNEMYADLKNRLVRNIETQEKEAMDTNAPPVKPAATNSLPAVETGK